MGCPFFAQKLLIIQLMTLVVFEFHAPRETLIINLAEVLNLLNFGPCILPLDILFQ